MPASRRRVAGAGFLTEIANGHRYQVALELAWPRFHDGTSTLTYSTLRWAPPTPPPFAFGGYQADPHGGGRQESSDNNPI